MYGPGVKSLPAVNWKAEGEECEDYTQSPSQYLLSKTWDGTLLRSVPETLNDVQVTEQVSPVADPFMY